MLSSPDTPQVLLDGLACMALSTATESIVLGLPDLAWATMFLQPAQNFLNHLITVRGLTVLSFFAQQMFFYGFHGVTVKYEHVNMNSQISLCCMFICEVFQSHIEWNNAQSICAPTATILPSAASTFNGLNNFGHMIYIPHLAYTKLLQNFWLTRVILFIFIF